MRRIVLTALAFLALLPALEARSTVRTQPYGMLSTGEEAHRYLLTNSAGSSLVLTDYGARIVKICVPDRTGAVDNVIVGPDDLETFEKGRVRSYGCVLGRYANRINHASFTLDGVRYELEANEMKEGIPVQCHGGPRGFDRFCWEGKIVKEKKRVGVRFHRLSPHGEGGFPGNCDCFVTYWLTEDNTVKIEYEATTDKPTVINLSNHAFFNLKGSEGGPVMDLLLKVEADRYIQNNAQTCPDLILPVEDSPFDFREPHRVDYRINMPNEQLRIMRGMSICWLLRDGGLRQAADLFDPGSGRGVQTWTTEPGLIIFCSRSFHGMALETLHFPDSPNQDRFPSTILRPGEKFYSTTEWRFYTAPAIRGVSR